MTSRETHARPLRPPPARGLRRLRRARLGLLAPPPDERPSPAPSPPPDAGPVRRPGPGDHLPARRAEPNADRAPRDPHVDARRRDRPRGRALLRPPGRAREAD